MSRKNVVRNYSIAFLNSCIDEISIDDFLVMRNVRTLLQENRQMLYALDFPGVTLEQKVDVLDEVLEKFALPSCLGDLFALLIKHKRTALICPVLAQVCSLYKKRKKILFFRITSAHSLQEDELETIQQFLANKTEKTVLYEWALDKNLIAGIRCQSETLVWEHSVRKQLDDLRRHLILQGTT